MSRIDWDTMELQAIFAGARSYDLIKGEEQRKLLDDVVGGLTDWTPNAKANESTWQMYCNLSFAGVSHCETNGLKRCHVRMAKNEKLKKGMEAMRRLQDPDDMCIDIVGDGLASRMISGKTLAKRCIDGYNKGESYKSPWETVSKMTRYWGEGDVMVIAGMSSTGKTNLALQMTCFNGIETLYFGVDMSDKGIAKRLWEIDWYRKAHAIYPEYYDNNEVRAMCEKAFRKAVMDNEVEVPENIQVWDSDNMSLDQIEFESRQKLKEKKYGALIIDYATRLDIGSEKDLWRAEQKAMRGIKAMAKRLKIPVIALSQFNKEAKPYMKPEYSWLSGSSELFSSSDIVLAIWLSKNADGTADQNKLNLSDDLKNRDAGVHGDTILNRYGLWLTQGSDF
jgi:hypothetical protein